MGVLQSRLDSGPFGSWDETNVIHVKMPGGALASAEDAAVLSGLNRLLVRTEAGWELLAWQKAELVGTDEWRLSRLRRGLNGSPIGGAETGADIVLSDSALIDIPMRPDEVGASLLWKAGEAEADRVVWNGIANRPWRVAMLQARQNDAKIDVTWRANGPGYSPTGELLDLNREVRFEIKVRVGAEEQNLGIVSAPIVSLDPGAAEEISVAQIGRDGQRGEWLSIPLPSP